MINVEDVQEASMFFPEEGEVGLMVRTRSMLPYVRRALNEIYGAPSTTGEVYTRFGGLKVYTIVDEVEALERQGIASRVNLEGLDIYYVCQKGQRITPSVPKVAIRRDLSLLTNSNMQDYEVWLYLADKYPVCFEHLCPTSIRY